MPHFWPSMRLQPFDLECTRVNPMPANTRSARLPSMTAAGDSPIDVMYDMRTDAGGKDPDQHSATLRRYHQLLWSKPLPNGQLFDLDASVRYHYLLHESDLGMHSVGSDTIVHPLHSFGRMAPIIAQVPDELIQEVVRVGQTIAGRIVFPGNVIDRKPTINGARGMHPRIRDRWDLTVECIRRHYLGLPNPLAPTLDRYRDFFALFESFEGYVEFFLLQDQVSGGGMQVTFYLPCEDFERNAFPTSLDEYWRYRDRTLEFVTARAERIDAWARVQLR